MSTLKTHNLQSPDSGSANIALAPNAGMVVAGISTFSNNIIANTKIGIGTENPTTILHLLDDSNDCDITVQATASGKDARINLYAHSGGVSQIRLGDQSDANVGLITYDHSNNSLQLRAGDNERLRIDANGKVIIGTEYVNAANANAAISLFLSGTRSGSYGGQTTNAIIFDNQTAAVDAGGSITLAGYSGTQAIAKALIRGGNEADAATQAGYFSVFVRPSSGGLTERIRVDSYGVLRIGNTHAQTTSGNTKRIALGAKGSIFGWTSGNINGAITMADNYYWDGANNKAIENDYSAYLTLRSGALRFGSTNQTHSAGGNISGGIHEKFRIETNGNATINDGDLVIGTSGHGILFSATANGTGTNQNELLDDYEEGDWQPKVSAGGANWSTTGRYTKVGRLVTIQADITNTSGSGTTEIHNLPFAVDSKYGTWHVGYAAVNGTTTSGNTNYTGGLIHFQGSGYLRARASGGTTNVTMNNNHRTIFTGTYYTT